MFVVLFCKIFHRIYATKCTNCLETINSNELVMRVHGFIYHLSCFFCIWCKRQLKKGDKFALRGHQPICEIDLSKSSSSYGMEQSHHSHSQHLPSLNHHDIVAGYDDMIINGLSITHSPTTIISDNKTSQPHLTMLQPPSLLSNHDNNSSDHQYSPPPRSLTICDSPMIITKNDQQQQSTNQPPTSSSNSSSQSYQSPSHTTNNNCNSNSLMLTKNNSTTSPTTIIKQDGRRGPKRPRTILTTAQRRAFKASFEISQKPCRKVNDQIFVKRNFFLKEVNFNYRYVKHWPKKLASVFGLFRFGSKINVLRYIIELIDCLITYILIVFIA